MSTLSRRAKWHPTPPPPPSPKILHFPRSRRTRRKQTKPAIQRHHDNNPLRLTHQKYLSYKGKLENLFDQENDEFPATHKTASVERRERVEEVDIEDCAEHNGGGGFKEEKWRFQAEILRAECNLLRMEREVALRKLEKNKVKMERTLRSAVQTLVSGRKKIFEGKNVSAVWEEDINDLAEKLEELQKSSRVRDSEIRSCSNFDKKASLLQRQLEKLGGLSDKSCAKDLQELAESIHMRRDIDKESNISNCKTENKSTNVDLVNEKMEGLSKGILDRVEEECNSIVSSTANSSVASSASTSKRIECPEFSCFSTRQLYQELMPNENKCSGRCKAIVRRIVEQVRAETEQWSQMQEMLRQVRGEMEELQASRDYWENRALSSDCEIQSLRHAVEEWKGKALDYENKANDLQLELSVLKEEMQKSKVDLNTGQNRITPDLPLGAQLVKERLALSCRLKKNRQKFDKDLWLEELNIEENKDRTPNRDSPPLPLGKQLAKEKKMLLHRLKENCHAASEEGSNQELSEDRRRKPYSNSIGDVATKRSPLRDIGNSSPLARQNSRAAYDFRSPESSRTRESFRK